MMERQNQVLEAQAQAETPRVYVIPCAGRLWLMDAAGASIAHPFIEPQA
jgi:hypothetical protein